MTDFDPLSGSPVTCSECSETATMATAMKFDDVYWCLQSGPESKEWLIYTSGKALCEECREDLSVERSTTK
jgi:hypothetical protein